MSESVRQVTASEASDAGAVLANAFSDDPIYNFILGQQATNEARLLHTFLFAVEAEQRRSDHLVERVGSGNAVALWREVDMWKPPLMDMVRGTLSAVKTFGTRLPRAMQVLTAAEKVHPPEPHRHLAFIGTQAGHQGQGLASALIRSMLERCDNKGIPTYLESTNPANDAWYSSFGYESRGPVPLPSGAPVLTAMWRDAR